MASKLAQDFVFTSYFPNSALISALQQMALLGILPTTLCRPMIQTHGRVALDWDL